jgi:hypothetical protein
MSRANILLHGDCARRVYVTGVETRIACSQIAGRKHCTSDVVRHNNRRRVLQLILGALMRHTNAGLAIPDFPLALGHLIPPFTSNKVIIHFAHRVGAVIVASMIVWTFSRISRPTRTIGSSFGRR